MKGYILLFVGFIFLFPGRMIFAQISPGPLASVHSHLEGISKCTLCHTLGNKVTNDKCLACHTDIRVRLEKNIGYHTSSEVKGKNCTQCHSDHHGETFQIVRFDRSKFNHNLTGFPLTGAHAGKLCVSCHKKENIADKTIRSKKFTFLGVSRQCNTCHEDYHQGTLPSNCTNCHTNDAFKPASKFSHAATAFQLKGLHQQVPCTGCHKTTQRNGKKFQEFARVSHKNCSDCHTDPHKGKFGATCSQCHTETSFRTVKGISNFDHSKTNFPLENKHQLVPCQSCHKGSYSSPLKYARCDNCHEDYHRKQFLKNGTGPDCNECHSTSGFQGSSFTIEKHNKSTFPLTGGHLATPCSECHKKQQRWNFREIGKRCSDCHNDIHQLYISNSYYPGKDCEVCHRTPNWTSVSFDHEKTTFPLEGAHKSLTCRKCHFRKDSIGEIRQRFAGLEKTCSTCHEDAHYSQFDKDGISDCRRCHGFGNWKIGNFDHDRTNFRLDGRHRNVPCQKCHKPVTIDNRTFVLYKIKDTRCESCH